MRSFRTRLALGFMLTMTGLLTVTTILTLYAVHLHPGSQLWLHNALISLVALACIGIGLLVVRRSLSPFDTLRSRLADVREGRARALEGRFPDEVQPLVEDLNGLLANRDRMVERAMARAGDLAHGLKTPLAILQREADRLAAAGQVETGAVIAAEIARMQRQTSYHLAQARAAASGPTSGVRCIVLESAEAIARTLRRLRPDGPAIELDVAPAHAVRVRREDLDEMLGNLLDNASAFAASRVRLRSRETPAGIDLLVEDDGPGLPQDQWSRVLQRGVRADEAGPGTGLGLAIVRELAELHGGDVVLGRSELGGLRAALTLPAAGSSTPPDGG